MPRIQVGDKIFEGTEEQLTEFMNELPDVESAPQERSFRDKMLGTGVAEEAGIRRDFGKDVASTAAGLVEGASAGLLKPSEFIEGAPEGNALGKIGGFIAGPGKLIRGATTGLKVAPLIRGAVEGAAGGFAFPTDGNVDERIKNAKFGALLGAPLEVAITGLGAAWRGLQKYRQAKQAMKQLDNEKFAFKGSPEFNTPQKLQLREKRLSQAKKEILQTQKSSIDEQTKALSEQLEVEAQSQAQAIKQPTLDYMRRFKDEWGQNFDELLETAPEQGIKISELRQIEEEVVQELTEMGIDPKGTVVRTMKRSVNSFKPSKIFKNVDETVFDDLGTPMKRTTQVAEEADDLIKNRDLVNVRRNVRRSLSSQAKQGQYTEEDIAQAIFDEKLGAKLSATLGEGFDKLNASYKNFSNLSRFAYKNLRPKASEFEIMPGTRIIKKVATGKATEGEVKAIQMLEEATGVKFTDKASQLGSKIDELKNLKKNKIQEIQTKFAKRQAELSRMKRQAGQGNKDKIRKIDEEIRANQEIVESLGGPIGLTKRVAGNLAIAGLSGFVLNKFLRRQ